MEFIYDKKDMETCWYKTVCGKECQEPCLRHRKMWYLVKMAMLDGNMSHPPVLRPDEVDYNAFTRLKEIKQNVREYVNAGKNLLIYSTNTGNGKTKWAIKILLAYLDSIWATSDVECRAIFVSMPKFMFAAKNHFDKPDDYYDYIMENIFDADLVVWDEINFKEWTSYEQDIMLNIINQRIEQGKSNIYTTNFDLPTIEQMLGARLNSRIVGLSEKVQFFGGDKRGLDI